MAGATYWVGTDGNVWLNGSNGVQNMGTSLGGNANGFDAKWGSAEAQQIADPNPGGIHNAAQAAPSTSPAASVAQGGSYGSSGSAYPKPDTAALANAYNASFDAQTQGIQNSMSLAQQIANSGKNRTDNSYNVQSGGLDQQYGAGNANLDLSQNNLNTSKSNSLRDLGNQMRLSQQSYSNQLGVAGAGDSSAAGVLNYALSQQANRQHGDIMNNVDHQQTGINEQRSQLQTGFDQNKKMLDDWHASQIQNIVNQYATQMQQFQQSLAQAQGQKAIDLAYIGKGQAANDAVNQLKSLQSQYGSHMADLQGAYSNITAPSASLGPQLTSQYNVQPISAGQISAQNIQNNTVTGTPSNYTAGLVKKSSDQQSPLSYAYQN